MPKEQKENYNSEIKQAIESREGQMDHIALMDIIKGAAESNLDEVIPKAKKPWISQQT